MAEPAGPPRAMGVVVAAVALATIVAIAAAWWLTRDRAPVLAARPPARAILAPRPVVPLDVVPAVEPIAYADLSNDEARALNARVPFSTDANPAARPFSLAGPPLDRARAQDCLASAMLYEAGSADPEGQRAVAQVVINRLRHPAFPKTICGVVFQGQERRTGCQFTFTCDGALGIVPRPAAWEDARTRALAMLDGGVFSRVGHSTHYHTDWVVPYWSASLDKVTAVRTHLFFRWSGWWGTPSAFRGGHSGPEPRVAKLAFLSAAHRGEGDDTTATTAIDTAGLSLTPLLEDAAGTMVILIDAGLPADEFPFYATAACGERDYCKLFAWTDKARLPARLPVTDAQAATMAFSYLRDRTRRFEKGLWNCAQFPRPAEGQCMKPRALPVRAGDPPATQRFRIEALPGGRVRAQQVPELRGVRRSTPAPAEEPAANQVQPVR